MKPTGPEKDSFSKKNSGPKSSNKKTFEKPSFNKKKEDSADKDRSFSDKKEFTPRKNKSFADNKRDFKKKEAEKESPFGKRNLFPKKNYSPGKNKSFSDNTPSDSRKKEFKKDSSFDKKKNFSPGKRDSSYFENKRSDSPRKEFKKDSSYEKTPPSFNKKKSFKPDPSSLRNSKSDSPKIDYKKASYDKKKSFTPGKKDSSFSESKRADSSKKDFKKDSSFEKKSFSNKKEDFKGKEKSFPKKKKFEKKDFNSRTEKTFSTPTYDLHRPQKAKKETKPVSSDDTIRLNRFIGNAGICSRREADTLIELGEITVNGKVITELGYKVNINDVVKYNNKVIKPQKHVYVLLNKPKDFITTTDDPQERKTVMSLVANACKERIYPVGRLDRNTTGLLLLTNDGELAKKLTHPSSNIKKLYQADLNKPLTRDDFDKIVNGLKLEDGPVHVDALAYVTPDKTSIGIEIHEGRNRIVRRIFEHLGYDVVKLDRVAYAGLTKKDLPRGKWKFLSEKEVIQLKFFL